MLSSVEPRDSGPRKAGPVKSIGSRIRQRRESLGWSIRRLGREANLSGTYIGQIEKGTRQPTDHALRSIAAALGTTIEELRGEVPAKTELPVVTPGTLREAARQLYDALGQAGEVVMVARAGIVSAGPGASDQALIPYLPEPTRRGHEFRWVEVRGTCMEPRIRSGHIAIVDLDAEPRVGDLVAVEHDHDYLIRELRERDGRWTLVAVNEHEPIMVTDQTHILGVVVTAQYRP